MVPSLSIVSTASLTSRMTVTMEACGGKKEEISFEIQSFKVKNARYGVGQGCPITSGAFLMAAHYCQSCLQRGLCGLPFSRLSDGADFDVGG